MALYYILIGALIGFVVGITGVGGGSFMTPILLLFGIPPATAIGTDLLYAGLTKTFGVIAHKKQDTINWKVVIRLMTGSIPASIVTVFILHNLQKQDLNYSYIVKVLGIMLIITAIVVFFDKQLVKAHIILGMRRMKNHPYMLKYVTIVIGATIGVLVTITSVGAGAICASALLLLYPKMKINNIVGTDIAHAVPLTLIAGLGHLKIGNVDFKLLLFLLCGSLPAVWIASKISIYLPRNILQFTMALALLILGLKYVINL